MPDMKMILQYLTDLEVNNNKEWYASHKEERLQASEEFENLIHELILKIGEYDTAILHNNPKDLTFKMVRDTRFSHDKSPYNPVFRANIAPQGKLPIPVGYYLFLKPGDRTFLGGGLFANIFTDATASIRDYISSHPDELSEIITNPEFSDVFAIMGTKLKNVPKGYDPANKMAEYLKHKSWYLESPVKDRDLLDSASFINMATEQFKLMKPFHTYLNTALKDFRMPERK